MIYRPPLEVEYKGVVYEVHDEHRNIIDLINLYESEKDPYERSIMVVSKIFGIDAPVESPLLKEAIEIINNGIQPSQSEGVKQQKSVDYVHDYSTIRMDVLREYGIDILNGCRWCDFLEMVANLGENSTLNRIVQARTMDLSKIKDKELKKAWSDFKKQVALPVGNDNVKAKVDNYYDNLMKRLKKGG